MSESDRSNSDSSAPWYADGLRFTCTQCGYCCSGDPGFVFVNHDEIRDMAGEMDLDVDAFEERFVRRVGRRRSLKEYADGDCILLDPKTRRCMVYHSRPIQCRTWPFWSSNLVSPDDWRETCAECPGAGTGQLYTLEQIEAAKNAKRV
ncbi:YkgJ family cysteine cluster protein [Crateriforma conspicua]|uniref:Flagellin N-methylase n=1 Tax=Crateriforma conspicua TaxID=2527996 RepID=A0A5C5Y463_9PLAN|nr:YkgJ family cysteine cluster protein [Crateriforma conspicua]QDV64217.1 Flagellin N-methylase [Crateriforma conspicua]TWT69609.1 Flagellin N-methylase [Crateriforma conspicua]